VLALDWAIRLLGLIIEFSGSTIAFGRAGVEVDASTAGDGEEDFAWHRTDLFANGDAKGWRAQATPWSGKISAVVTSLDERAFPARAIPG
jgi:hypothetical protein